MSSLTRRLEIRILRQRGYVRQTKAVVVNKITNIPEIVALKHGNIINPAGEDTGSPFWPNAAHPAPTLAEAA